MRFLWILTSLLIASTAILTLFFPETGRGWIAATSLCALVLLTWLLIAVVLPARTASLGMSLLKSGEYNNRLAPVREPHAAKVVKVFNSLMARLSEESLKVEEINNLLNLLIQASPTGVVMLDFDYNVSFVNPAFERLSGTDSTEILNRKYDSLTGTVWETAVEMKIGDERIIPLGDREICRLSKLSFMEKGFRRVFLLLDRLTDEIRKAEKEAYGKVIRTMAHEVNNTVGGVNSLLETIVDIEGEETELGQLAQSCISGCLNLSEFIRRYAEVVKIGEPVLHTVRLNDELTEALPFLGTLMKEGVKLEVDLAPENPEVRIDTVMMRQVLVNIVKNAAESVAEAGVENGKVTLRTRTEGRETALEIEDNGKGIPHQSRHRLFDPFYTTKQNGQGIGLTMTAEILRRHRFAFTLDTPEPGRTLFTIRLATPKS